MGPQIGSDLPLAKCTGDAPHPVQKQALWTLLREGGGYKVDMNVELRGAPLKSREEKALGPLRMRVGSTSSG